MRNQEHVAASQTTALPTPYAASRETGIPRLGHAARGYATSSARTPVRAASLPDHAIAPQRSPPMLPAGSSRSGFNTTMLLITTARAVAQGRQRQKSRRPRMRCQPIADVAHEAKNDISAAWTGKTRQCVPVLIRPPRRM